MRDINDICLEIRAEHRKERFATDTLVGAENALGAYIRRHLGWGRIDKEKVSKEEAARLNRRNENAKAEAKGIMEAAKKIAAGKPADVSKLGHFSDFSIEAVATFQVQAPMLKIQNDCRKAMTKLVKELPIWAEFVDTISGLGELSVARIIGEAGNLSNYDSPAKLWRRMGLAPFDAKDGRRHLGSHIRKLGASNEFWIEAGYSRRRRSIMYVVSTALLKSQSIYTDLFHERQVYEFNKAVAAGLIPSTTTKTTAEGWAKLGVELTVVKKTDPDIHMSAGYMTAKAKVYVEKRVLRDLWRCWRRCAGQSYECLTREGIDFMNAA